MWRRVALPVPQLGDAGIAAMPPGIARHILLEDLAHRQLSWQPLRIMRRACNSRASASRAVVSARCASSRSLIRLSRSFCRPAELVFLQFARLCAEWKLALIGAFLIGRELPVPPQKRPRRASSSSCSAL